MMEFPILNQPRRYHRPFDSIPWEVAQVAYDAYVGQFGAQQSIERIAQRGGTGYAPGSYWDGDAIICGACGARIENPAPTGSYVEYYDFWEAPLKWWRREVKLETYTYGGVRGRPGCSFED